MTRSRITAVATIALVLLLAPGAARAGAAADPEPLKAYFELDGHGTWVSVPDVERSGTAIVTFGGPPTRRGHPEADSEIEDWGGGFDTRFGFNAPGLSRWQIELGGGFAEVNDGASETRALLAGSFTPTGLLASHFLVAAEVDGTPDPSHSGILGMGDQSVKTTVDGDFEFWELRFVMARALDVPGLSSFRARIGVVGGRIDHDYQIDQQVLGTSIFNGPNCDDDPGAFIELCDIQGRNEVIENAENSFVGPLVGLGLAASLFDLIRLTLETEVAFLYHQTDLVADQTWTGAAFAMGGDFLGCAPRCVRRVSETDDQDKFGVRPRARVGIDFDLGFAILGLTGTFTYWTYAPQIVNPTVPRFPDFVGIGPTRLSSADMLSAEAGARITFPFGR